MNTERLQINSDVYSKTIDRAAEILRSGGTVAIPTETVYGLAASAYDEKAVSKIFTAKGRPQDNPLIVHIGDISMLKDITTDITDKALACAEAFWPGPFTMVLKRSNNIPESVSAGLDTVAVRMPSDSVARDVIKASGLPLAAPSANASGSPSPTNPYHVLNDLDGKIDAVIIGEESGVGLESTVVSLTTNPPRLLRPGGITVEELLKVLPDLVVDPAVLTELKKGEKAASPGMKYKHYAPKTETVLVLGETDKFVNFVNTKTNCLAVCFDEECDYINIKNLSYGSMYNTSDLAHNLFSMLRSVDNMQVETVYIHAPEKTGVGLAVYNRLIRAAAFKVVEL